MTRETQQATIQMIQQYNNTNADIVKRNLKQYIEKYRYNYVAESLGVGIQTVYQWTKAKGNRPSFYTALLVCELLDITIDELMKEN